MTASISLADRSAPVGHSQGGASTVALQDQLARRNRQLGDCLACPSSKTPEGKQIFANLRAQIKNLESRVGANSPESLALMPVASVARISTFGSLVSTYA